jgi:hypothetical protein
VRGKIVVLEYIVLSFVSAAVAVALAAYVSLRSPRKDMAIRFSVWTLTIALVSLGDGFRKIYAAADDQTLTLFWTEVTVLGGILFIPTFVEFCQAFPPKLETRRWILLWSSIAISGFLISLLIMGYLIEGLIKTSIGYSTNFSRWILLLAPAFTLLTGTAFVRLVRKTWNRAPYYKTHFGIFGAIMVGGIITTLVPPIQEALADPPTLGLLSASAVSVFANLVLKQKFLLLRLAESALETPLKEKLSEGHAYLFYQHDSRRPYAIFTDYITHAYAGLLITKVRPNILKEEFQFQNTPALWLTEVSAPNTVHPKDLESLSFVVESFCDDSKRVIIIQGLELIIAQNGLERTLQFIRRSNSHVKASRSILLLTLSEYTLEPSNKSLFEKQVTFMT